MRIQNNTTKEQSEAIQLHNGTDIPQPDNEMHGDQKAPELQQPLLPSSPSHSEQQTVHDTIITQTTLGAVQVPQTVSQQPPQTIPLQQQAVSPQPQTLPTIPSQMVPLEPQTVSPQPQVISPQPQTLPIYPLQPQIVPLAPQIQQSMVPQVQQQVPPQQDVMLMVKRVTIGKRSISIVLQNINGPCPLIALANALILRGINFPDIHANVNYVSLDRLVEMLAGYLLENCSQKKDANVQYSIEEALSLLPAMKMGLDVNVQFTSIKSFEFTKELTIFDLMGISLVHGWLPDPSTTPSLYYLLKNFGYNRSVDKCTLAQEIKTVESKWKGNPQETLPVDYMQTDEQVYPIIMSISSPDELHSRLSRATKERLIQEGEMLRIFFQQYAHQLTEYGLGRLRSDLVENECAILFRNNHFSTICKHDGVLYLLCTDDGYYSQPDVVWERLADFSGNNAYCNGKFEVCIKPMREQAVRIPALHEDSDFALALKLQEEENKKSQLQQQQPVQGMSTSQQQQQQRQQQHRQPQPVPQLFVPPHTQAVLPESIREKNMKKGAKSQISHDRYANQGAALRQLNDERVQRQANPEYKHAYQQQHDVHARNRNRSDDCTIL